MFGSRQHPATRANRDDAFGVRSAGHFVRSLVSCILCWVGAVGGSASANDDLPVGPALHWVRHSEAGDCISPGALARSVEGEIGRPIFSSAAEALLSIEGYVAPMADGGYEATISLSDHRGNTYGTRELRTEAGCRELDLAVSLVISVMLAPGQAERMGIELPEGLARSLDALFAEEPTVLDPRSLPPPPAGPLEQGKQGEPLIRTTTSATRDRTMEDADSLSSDWKLWIGVGGWLGGGRQPGLDAGPFATVRLGWRALGSLRLRMRFGVPSEHSYTDTSGASSPGQADFQTLSSDLAVCRDLLEVASSHLGACFLADVGLAVVQTEGFVRDGMGSQLWFSAGLDLELRQPLGEDLALVGSFGPSLLLRRPDFQYRRLDGTSEELHRAPSLGWHLDLGVSMTFL